MLFGWVTYLLTDSLTYSLTHSLTHLQQQQQQQQQEQQQIREAEDIQKKTSNPSRSTLIRTHGRTTQRVPSKEKGSDRCGTMVSIPCNATILSQAVRGVRSNQSVYENTIEKCDASQIRSRHGIGLSCG